MGGDRGGVHLLDGREAAQEGEGDEGDGEPQDRSGPQGEEGVRAEARLAKLGPALEADRGHQVDRQCLGDLLREPDVGPDRRRECAECEEEDAGRGEVAERRAHRQGFRPKLIRRRIHDCQDVYC